MKTVRINYHALMDGLAANGGGTAATGCTLAKCRADRDAALAMIRAGLLTLDDLYLDADGNTKTRGVATVSLMPVIDCPNCRHCSGRCYDLAHDVIRPACRAWRAVNSALLAHFGPLLFWSRVFDLVDAAGVASLRINVGGDLREADFPLVWAAASRRQNLKILFFTKNFVGLSRALNRLGCLPGNVHMILSRWGGDGADAVTRDLVAAIKARGGRCGRSVIRDPRTGRLAVTGVRRAVECCGSCATCRRTCGGCWGLRGGYVVFDDHGANNKLA